MKVEAQKEHHWLERFVGEWEYEGEAIMGPDQPPMKWKGTESVRSIGGLWVQGEGTGEMPGGGSYLGMAMRPGGSRPTLFQIAT